MNTTTNLGLKMPEYNDQADIQDINDNMELLDGKMGAVGNTSVQEQIDDVVQEIGSTALPTTAQTLTGAIAEHETDLGTKADKVTGATTGHFAGLDANGNLVDSGKQASDFATPVDVEKKADAIEESNSTEAEVMSFSDGADNLPMDVSVAINPVQDLHGYSFPWIGGAGNNLVDLTKFTASSSNVTISVDGNEMRVTGNGSATYLNARVLMSKRTYSAGTYYIKFKVKNNAVLTSYTRFALRNSSGVQKAYISITSDQTEYAGTMTIEENCYLALMLNGNNTGTEYSTDLTVYDLIVSTTDVPFEPYENICPISGFTGMDIVRTGKNIVNPADARPGYIISSTTGTVGENTDHLAYVGFIPVKPNAKYTLSANNIHARAPGSTVNAYVNVVEYSDADRTYYLRRIVNSASNDSSYTFTISPDAHYIRFSVGVGASNIQIELGDNVTEYTPFVGLNQFQISFPSEAGTVYGGTLTINEDGSGTLLITSTLATIPTITDFSGTGGSGNWKYRSGIVLNPPQDRTSNTVNIISEILKGIAADDERQKWSVFTGKTSNSMSIYCDTNTTVEEFNTNIAGKTIVYKLATPVEVSITAQQVRSILGENNLWANSGNVLNVVYSADTKMYIDNLFNSILPATGVSF